MSLARVRVYVLRRNAAPLSLRDCESTPTPASPPRARTAQKMRSSIARMRARTEVNCSRGGQSAKATYYSRRTYATFLNGRDEEKPREGRSTDPSREAG